MDEASTHTSFSLLLQGFVSDLDRFSHDENKCSVDVAITARTLRKHITTILEKHKQRPEDGQVPHPSRTSSPIDARHAKSCVRKLTPDDAVELSGSRANDGGVAPNENLLRPVPTDSVIHNTRTPEPQGVPYDSDHDVLRFHPSPEQWPCFDEVLRQAKRLGAEHTGVFKVSLPYVKTVQGVQIQADNARSYRTRKRPNGTLAIVSSEDKFLHLESSFQNISTDEAITQLERTMESSNSLGASRYCTDIPARNHKDRCELGLPQSPIWPLPSNKLDQTKVRIPGIHWPYAYQSNAAIGAVFALHLEDFALFSLNMLYRGDKIWIIIPPSAKNQLESILKRKRKQTKCAQFVREDATYIPMGLLRDWGVDYKVVRQHPGDIMVTLPNTYHQGFSVGATLAEAVNFADESWDPSKYKACTADNCPNGFIGRDLMTLLEETEDQISADELPELVERSETECVPPKESFVSTKIKPCQLPPPVFSNKTRKTSKERTKRKRSQELNQFRSKKSSSVEHLSSNLSIPSSLSRPPVEEAYQEICRMNSLAAYGFDDGRCCLLTNIFFAIASPDAILQLREADASIKSSQYSPVLPKNNMADSINALDRLDATIHLYAILRRFHLVSICKHRDALLAETRRTRASNFRELGTSETLVHKQLMSYAYPGLRPDALKTQHSKNDYTRKSKALTRRLMIGHRWSTLEKEFSPGILALVPTGGLHQLSNSDFEGLPSSAIDLLIDMLKRHRGRFLRDVSRCLNSFGQPDVEFPFSNKDLNDVTNEEYDSPRLIELCKIEHGLPALAERK